MFKFNLLKHIFSPTNIPQGLSVLLAISPLKLLCNSQNINKCNTVDVVRLWFVLLNIQEADDDSIGYQLNTERQMLSNSLSTPRAPQSHRLREKERRQRWLSLDCINASLRREVQPVGFDLKVKSMACTELEKDRTQCFVREMRRWCEGKSRWQRTWTWREIKGAKRGHGKVLMCSTV